MSDIKDPVAIMRKVANGDEVTGNAMRKEVGGTDWSDALLILADMVERDYVRRDDYDFTVEMLNCMKAERDEWIAKYDDAEATIGRMQEVIDDHVDEIVDLETEVDELKAKAEGSSKVRVGQSNLEWLLENDRDFVTDWISKASYCRHCAFWDDCDGSMGSEDPKCIRGNREWLMASHEDCGNLADTSKKDADCAPLIDHDLNAKVLDVLKNAPGWAKEEISDNLRKSQDSEIDSREQLESDTCSLITRMIDDAYNMGLHEASWCANKQSIHECVKELLDRQATITKVECENTFLNRADEIITRRELEKRELQTQIAELQVESICLGDKANAAEEMLLFLLEGGDPNWLGWHDDHDGLCDYFKERFDETVPELKERIATQKRTIESYRDDSRELQERVDALVTENIKLIERTGELEDQLAATKRELKLTRGQLATTLNNWEQAKGKLRRQKADLDARTLNIEERENRTAEDVAFEKVEYWKGQCEKAREEAEMYRLKYGKAVNKAHEIIGGMD